MDGIRRLHGKPRKFLHWRVVGSRRILKFNSACALLARRHEKTLNGGTMTEREVFQKAYQDWKAAQKIYSAQMDQILAGSPYDKDELTAVVRELEATHKKFMEASKPFVYWR